MNARRSILVVLSLLLTFAGFAAAQATRPAGRAGPPGGGMAGLQRLQDAVAALDLSADQKKQVASLKDEVAETVRGMAGELKDLPPDERREKVKTALGDVREKFMSILTPQQQATLREKLKDERGENAGRAPGRRPLADLKPGGRGEGKGGGKEADGPMIARLRDALDGVGLSPEQKTQTDAILDDAATQAKQIRQDAAADRDAAREKATGLAQSVRQKLAAVLTPEQRQSLADAMPGGGRGGKRDAAKSPSTKPADGKANTVPLKNKSTDDKTTGPAAAKAAVASSRPTANAAPLVVGTPAPTFALTRLSGAAVTNKTFVDKPLVLAFGSLSSPAFRDRLPQLEALQYRYRGRATVAVVYTREAHPADGWQVDRNRDDKLEIKSPTTLAERTALAKQMAAKFKTGLDVLVDGLDDATLSAYGGNAEGAVVVSPFGTVIGTQKFTDPSGLPRLIDEALKAKS